MLDLQKKRRMGAGMNVQFTDQELANLRQLAERRNATHRPQDTRKIEDRWSDIQTNFVGIVGECAVAKYLGLPFDNAVLPGADDGVDLRIGQHTLQIKTTVYRLGRLAITDRFVADAAVLVYVGLEHGDAWICGWISRRHFENMCRPTTLKPDRPPVPAMTQNLLWPISELREIVMGDQRQGLMDQ